jgi:uncharacterized lipoprotein
MPVRAAVVIAVLAVLVAAGCGGGSSQRLSQDAYVSKADAICRDLDAKQRKLTAPASLDAIPAYVDQALPSVDDGIAKLSKLRPPAELDATVKSWLASLDDARGLLVDLGKAAAKNDAAKVQSLGAQATTLTEKTHALAGSIGLTDCANA